METTTIKPPKVTQITENISPIIRSTVTFSFFNKSITVLSSRTLPLIPHFNSRKLVANKLSMSKIPEITAGIFNFCIKRKKITAAISIRLFLCVFVVPTRISSPIKIAAGKIRRKFTIVDPTMVPEANPTPSLSET